LLSSPAASVSADLHSIIPAPVFSLSALIALVSLRLPLIPLLLHLGYEDARLAVNVGAARSRE
jgi:hypothetical protein